MSLTLPTINTTSNATMIINTNTLKLQLVPLNTINPSTDDFINTRLVKRIPFELTLFIRRLINSPLYFQMVKTLNVSRYGALISSQKPLKIGDELEITRPITSFKAKAIVRHITHDKANDRYLIGLDFQTISGKWIVI